MRAGKALQKLEEDLAKQEEAASAAAVDNRPIAQIIKEVKEAAETPDESMPSVKASTW